MFLLRNYPFSISYESFANETKCSVVKFERVSFVTQKPMQGITTV